MFGLVGFATLNGGTTGGSGGAIVDVYTDAQLSDALTSNTNPAIVRLHGQVDLDGSIKVKSNKTITSLGDGYIRYGRLNISQCNNVIVTNLRMSDATDDSINIEYAENIWVHRNTLENGFDGLCDIKHGSNYITVSWNYFKNHVKTMLIGHDNAATTDAGKLKTTIHHNWFEDCAERLPMVRFGEVHSYNNLFTRAINGVRADYEAQIYQENCYWDNPNRPYTYPTLTPAGWIKDVGSKFVDVITNEENRKVDRPEGVLWVPSSYYAYTPQDPDDVKVDVMAYAGQQAPYAGPWHYAPETGNDSGNGSEVQPFKTWSMVLSSLTNTIEGRQIKIKCGEVGYSITISSKPGTETEKYYVTNYGTGANPIISGFVNPTWVSQGGNIWAYTDSGFTNVNILKLGNTNQPKGRLPKTGYNTITGRTGNTQISDTVNLPTFPNVVGGELVSRKNKWIMDTQTITAQTSSTITTEIATGGYWYSVGYGYFVQNHVNCLTQNGDWYFDASSKTVYLYHTTDPNLFNIKIGKYENCLYQQSSSYWEFFGVDFEGSIKEAVILRSSHNVKFTRCSFNFHGLNGVQTWLSRYAKLEYCHFNDIQNIAVNNRDTGESLGSSDMLIRNCFLNGIAMIPGASGSGDGQACGVKIGGTEHNVTIQNNRFHNLGYIGIYAAGNNCLVESNYAENGCLIKADGALFYTFGSFTGIQFKRNIAINCIGNVDGTNHSDWFGVGDCAGFYADDNSNGVLFEDNYATSTQYGFYGHNCRNIIVRNNVFINNHIQVRLTDDGYDNPSLGDPIQNLNIYNNKLIAGSGQFIYELRATGGNLQYGMINNNQIKSTDENSYRIRREGTMPNPGTTLENLSQWRTNRGYDINSILYDYDQDKELILVNETEGTELFELDSVYEDVAGVEHSGSIQLDENESIYLYKTSDTPPVDEYTIDVTVIGSGSVSGSGTYEDGQEVDLFATPDAGWSFLHWSDIDRIYLDNPLNFIAEGNKSLEAIFVEDIPPVDEYNVTLIAGTGGTVSGGGTFESGTQATATATPNTGWHFVRWSNDVTDNPYTFTVTGDVTLQAIFAQDEPIPGVIIVKGKFRIV